MMWLTAILLALHIVGSILFFQFLRNIRPHLEPGDFKWMIFFMLFWPEILFLFFLIMIVEIVIRRVARVFA